jgi:streptomycin 6-kinase
MTPDAEPPLSADPAFVERITNTFGDTGAEWLESLGALVAEFAVRWRLDVGPAFPLGYNYVAPVIRADGTSAVLKVGVPSDDPRYEIEALRIFAGRGAATLLDYDVERKVFLLERIAPGTQLIHMHDDAAATRIAARLMRKLSRPLPEGSSLPTVADVGRGFGELRARHAGVSGPLPKDLFDYAESLYGRLVETQDAPAVLHGDLHPWNILSAERDAWLTIDPSGVAGEPAFEVCAWMRNPVYYDSSNITGAPPLVARDDVREVLATRLHIFADELGLGRTRLLEWSIAGAMLSACWSDQSGNTNHRAQLVEIAEYLASLQ